MPAAFLLLQCGDRLLADHAAIGHDADPAHTKPAPETIDDGDQRGDVRGVAGPQLAANRPPLAVEHRADDHWVAVGPMVLAEAALADVLAAFSFEINRSGVEEDELEISEEVAPVGEEILLDPVLDASWRERRLVLLLILGQLFTQPGHGSVEVMELQVVAAFDLVVRLPLVGGAVAAGVHEAMEHGEEDGALDVEFIASCIEELLDDVPAAGLLPEPLEDEGGADAPGGDGGELPLGVGREQQYRLGQACPRGQESIELAGLLELIEPPESGDDPLPGASVLPAVLDDLEVGASAGVLGAEEHGALVVRTP